MQNHGHKLSPPKNEKNRSDKHHYGGFPYHNTFRSAKVYDFKAPRLCFFKASAPNKTTFSYDVIRQVRKKHQSRSFDSHLTQKKHLRRYVLSLLSFPMTDFRQKDKTSMHTATGIVTDSHRVPFSPPKPVCGTLQPWRHSV